MKTLLRRELDRLAERGFRWESWLTDEPIMDVRATCFRCGTMFVGFEWDVWTEVDEHICQCMPTTRITFYLSLRIILQRHRQAVADDTETVKQTLAWVVRTLDRGLTGDEDDE